MRSLFVARVYGARSLRDKMAAPKSFEPLETPSRVRGMMLSSMVDSRLETRSLGGSDVEVVWEDILWTSS